MCEETFKKKFVVCVLHWKDGTTEYISGYNENSLVIDASLV